MAGGSMANKKHFERIRSDHRSEVIEDYLEAIAEFIDVAGQCRGGDLASHFSVSHATVTQTLGRLKDAGLIKSEPYGPISLTRSGRRIAKKSKERHQLVLSFLLSIGVSEEVAIVDSEGIEHHVSDETLACLTKFLHKQKNRPK